MTAHVHADLMAEYAKDAAKTDAPWLQWEVLYKGIWDSLYTHPKWLDTAEYRRKQKTKTVYQWAVTLNGKSWELTGSLYSSEKEVTDVWTNAIEVRRLDYTAMEVSC